MLVFGAVILAVAMVVVGGVVIAMKIVTVLNMEQNAMGTPMVARTRKFELTQRCDKWSRKHGVWCMLQEIIFVEDSAA